MTMAMRTREKQCFFKEQNYSTASEKPLSFVTVHNEKLCKATFYFIEVVTTRTTNCISVSL